MGYTQDQYILEISAKFFGRTQRLGTYRLKLDSYLLVLRYNPKMNLRIVQSLLHYCRELKKVFRSNRIGCTKISCGSWRLSHFFFSKSIEVCYVYCDLAENPPKNISPIFFTL